MDYFLVEHCPRKKKNLLKGTHTTLIKIELLTLFANLVKAADQWWAREKSLFLWGKRIVLSSSEHSNYVCIDSHMDCWDHLQDGGSHVTGVYSVAGETSLGMEQKQVYCDMDKNGGG